MRKDQIKNWRCYRILLWPALMVLVSACQTIDQVHMSSTSSTDPDAITPMKLTIAGKNINALLESESELEAALKYMAEHDDGYDRNLGILIDRLMASNLNPDKSAPGFKGINGALGQEFLTIVQTEALGPSGLYDTETSVIVSMEGQITAYEFDGSADYPGNGKMTVITAVTSRKYPSVGRPNPRVVGYKWEIEVVGDAFEVRTHSGNPANPFPNTMTFSQSMLNRVQSLGFRYKLWAEGTNIVVQNVWRKQNFEWDRVDMPNYWGQPLPRTGNSKWKRLYESDADSCIDMMFVLEPPAKFEDLRGPPWYCLGRCQHPGIVNSR